MEDSKRLKKNLESELIKMNKRIKCVGKNKNKNNLTLV